MRTALAAVLVLGCAGRPLDAGSSTTGHSTTTSGSTTSGSTTSASTTSGSTTSGTTTGSSATTGSPTTSGSTTSTTGPNGGMCDVIKQDCAAGEKCIGQWDSSFSLLQGVCVSDGTIGLGQACTSSATTTFMYDDDCKKGLVCDDIYGNSPLVCRKICADDSDCKNGEQCGDFTYAQMGWGWCAPSCTPFSSGAGNCSSGLDCADFVDATVQADPNGGVDGFFLCKLTGDGAVFATCTTDADCGKGLWCSYLSATATQVCLPDCSDSMACPQPTGDAGDPSGSFIQCEPYANAPGHAGYCYGN